jgi:hypothetical protein
MIRSRLNVYALVLLHFQTVCQPMSTDSVPDEITKYLLWRGPGAGAWRLAADSPLSFSLSLVSSLELTVSTVTTVKAT